jgi:5-methylcytosine-specific restriction endonuclease McrA
MSYKEKLKNPKWQKKRLKVLERDNWSCQNCFTKNENLQVHHKTYVTTIQNPWDYPDLLLITLCDKCHEEERIRRPIFEQKILRYLRIHCTLTDLESFTETFFP